MIKLKNAEGKCQFIWGTTGLNYKHEAMKATGKTKMCKTVKNTIAAMAMQALETALLCGYDQLYSVDDANRMDKVVNVQLPACISDAKSIILKICLENGRAF